MRDGLRERIGAASGTLALQLLLGLALILGLRVRMPDPPAPDPALLVEVRAVPPPVQSAPRKAGARTKVAAAPPGLRARATDIVAAPPLISFAPPVIAAPIADWGTAANTGASDLAGPGTGAGGSGNGRGSGGDGLGGTPPQRLKGALHNSDYPRAAAEMGAGGTVGVRYRVGVDGRVTQCLVTATSGNAALDDATCSLIERRFRFAPARDEDGRPVGSTIVESHSWFVVRPDPEP